MKHHIFRAKIKYNDASQRIEETQLILPKPITKKKAKRQFYRLINGREQGKILNVRSIE